MKKWLSLLAICLLLTGCSSVTAPELRQPVGAAYDTAIVQRGDVSLKEVYNASVTDEFVPLLAPCAGRVENLNLTPGCFEQELRAEVGTSQLQAQYDARKTALEKLEESCNQRIRLLELDYAAKEADLEAGSGNPELLKLDLRAIAADLTYWKGYLQEKRDQEQRALTRLETEIENSRVYGPCDGVMVSLSVQEGDYVRAGTELMRVAQTGSEYLICTEGGSALAKTGSRCEARIGSEIYPLELIEYTQAEFVAAQTKGSVPARFRLPENAKVPQGTGAQLIVYVREAEDALYVPRAAVYDRTGLNAGYVYCIVNGEKVYTEVTVAFFTEAWAVIASGLEEGSVVYVPQSS